MKLYPFSARKHAHDLHLRRNVAYLALDKHPDLADRLQDLIDRLDSILIQACGCVPVIWLSGDDLALANESVAWAANYRTDCHRR